MFHLIPDDDTDGDGLSSASSSAASSSFSSAGLFSDADRRDRPWQSEVEEIPSFRWLAYSPSPVRKPPRPKPSTEVDWGHLVSAQGMKPRARQFTENSWVVLVEDDAAIENRCALVLAPGLEIKWQDKEISCWRYHAGAAVLRRACSLDIRAKVDAADLFPQTACVCVLVFQLLPTAFGLGETQEAWVSVGGRLASRRTVRLQQPGELGSDDVAAPRRRGDGWLEIELGGFSAGTYAGEGEAMVEMGLVTATGWVTDHSGAFLQTPCVRALTGLREVERVGLQTKGGLVVRGVEVRPERFAGAGGKREGKVWVSSVRSPAWALRDVDAQPFDVGGCWMLSCWLAPFAVTRMHDGGGSESFPERILQRSYADWVPRDLDPTLLDLKREPKLKAGNRTRTAAPYRGLRFGFTRAAS